MLQAWRWRFLLSLNVSYSTVLFHSRAEQRFCFYIYLYIKHHIHCGCNLLEPAYNNVDSLTLRMTAVSSISAMNVDTPFIWQSLAPTLAKMESMMETEAESQGTKHPIWAISTITPACRGEGRGTGFVHVCILHNYIQAIWTSCKEDFTS